MRFLPVCFLALGALAINGSVYGQTKRVSQAPNNIRELYQFLYQCGRFLPSEGSEITLKFSLTHYGALRGKPKITYTKLVGGLEDQRAFVSAALDALETCTPVPVTSHFGKVVAQKVIFITFPGRRLRPV